MSGMEIAWTVVGIIVPSGVGIGYGAVALAPADFRLARICFWFSAALLGGMDIVWYMQTGESFLWRLTVSGIIGAAIFVLLPEGLRFVYQRELLTLASPSPPPLPATPKPPETLKTPETAKVERPSQVLPRADHSTDKTTAKIEQPNVIIQTAPTFGNISERATTLANDIEKDLYLNGWTFSDGHIPHGLPFGIEKLRKQIPPDDDGTWGHHRSDHFYFGFLQKVLDIRNEFAQLHLRDEELDDFFRYLGMREDADRKMAALSGEQRSTHILPQEIEQVAERLRVLAGKVP